MRNEKSLQHIHIARRSIRNFFMTRVRCAHFRALCLYSFSTKRQWEFRTTAPKSFYSALMLLALATFFRNKPSTGSVPYFQLETHVVPGFSGSCAFSLLTGPVAVPGGIATGIFPGLEAAQAPSAFRVTRLYRRRRVLRRARPFNQQWRI